MYKLILDLRNFYIKDLRTVNRLFHRENCSSLIWTGRVSWHCFQMRASIRKQITNSKVWEWLCYWQKSSENQSILHLEETSLKNIFNIVDPDWVPFWRTSSWSPFLRKPDLCHVWCKTQWEGVASACQAVPSSVRSFKADTSKCLYVKLYKHIHSSPLNASASQHNSGLSAQPSSSLVLLWDHMFELWLGASPYL